MKERGMIFNAEMVRAVLAGSKTQTRRIMKVQPSEDFNPLNMALETDFKAHWYTPGVVDKDGYLQPAKKQVFGVASEDEGYACPFGAVGDRLWVRETFQGPLFDAVNLDAYLREPEPFEKPEYCKYAADGGPRPEFFDADDNLRYAWKPSIHMPRWASRITLEITGVRVERLQDISEGDVDSEGLGGNYPTSVFPEIFPGEPDDWSHLTIRECYGVLWKSIYGEYSWQANPWVWVIEFRRVEGGSDD